MKSAVTPRGRRHAREQPAGSPWVRPPASLATDGSHDALVGHTQSVASFPGGLDARSIGRRLMERRTGSDRRSDLRSPAPGGHVDGEPLPSRWSNRTPGQALDFIGGAPGHGLSGDAAIRAHADGSRLWCSPWSLVVCKGVAADALTNRAQRMYASQRHVLHGRGLRRRLFRQPPARADRTSGTRSERAACR